MTKSDFQRYLDQLGLTQTDAARLLSVTDRTVRRWLEEEDFPGPVQEALKAWAVLHRNHLPWGPNCVAIAEDNLEQIAAWRAHAAGLSSMLARVEFRGGARIPWKVDVEEGTAELGPMRVTFYRFAGGGFALSTYARKDQEPNAQRDREFIEDAAWSIARALKAEKSSD